MFTVAESAKVQGYVPDQSYLRVTMDGSTGSEFLSFFFLLFQISTFY